MHADERSAERDTPIVRFYRGAGTDSRGRSLEEILRWDDDRLEHVHDFIQWLFPLDEPSLFNPDAPLLTPADRAAFRQDAQLAANLRRSLARMLAFYGLRWTEWDADVRVERSSDWNVRAAAWMQPHNHNHLRLTRILKSLQLLGASGPARALYQALKKEAERAHPGRISGATLAYWKEAIRLDR